MLYTRMVRSFRDLSQNYNKYSINGHIMQILSGLFILDNTPVSLNNIIDFDTGNCETNYDQYRIVHVVCLI